MIKFLLAPAAALALMAGTALAAPVAPHTGTAATTAPAAADWGISKQKVGYKRRKVRGHGFKHRRLRGHRFGHRRFFSPRFRGYYGGYHRRYGFRSYGVRGPGTVR